MPDDVYESTKEHFSEEELVKLTIAVATINVLEPVAITFRSDVGSYQRQRAPRRPAPGRGENNGG